MVKASGYQTPFCLVFAVTLTSTDYGCKDGNWGQCHQWDSRPEQDSETHEGALLSALEPVEPRQAKELSSSLGVHPLHLQWVYTLPLLFSFSGGGGHSGMALYT